MQLVSKGFVRYCIKEGLLPSETVIDNTLMLSEWLKEQGLAVDHPAVARYFGCPYLPLEKGTHLRPVILPEQTRPWSLYFWPQKNCYLCTCVPLDVEKQAFRKKYGDASLYITDAIAVQAARLAEVLPTETLSSSERVRYFSLDALLRQEQGHIDGVIGRILEDAIETEATDIHLYRLEKAFHIDFRVAGQIERYASLRASVAKVLINKLKLMAEMDIAEHRLPQDGHIELRAQQGVYHLRLGTLPLLEGEKLVIRVLPEQQRLTSFEALGFSEEQIGQLHQMLAKRQGLLLITGPTNSGKTTTLYACLQALAQTGALVYTIEDPVEVVLPQVQQMQVNNLSGFSFAAGLRGILRSDPDVLAVGELRDRETVDIAAKAALSGHLVVATLHAYDAHQTINRLRDLGLSDLLMSAVLLAVVNQRLLSRRCQVCGGSGTIETSQCCPHCMGSGRDGRLGIQEIWQPSTVERAQIEKGISGFELRQQAIVEGFWSLDKQLHARAPWGDEAEAGSM